MLIKVMYGGADEGDVCDGSDVFDGDISGSGGQGVVCDGDKSDVFGGCNACRAVPLSLDIKYNCIIVWMYM